MRWTLVFFQFIGDLIFSQLSMNATVTDHCISTILNNFLSQSFHIQQSEGISQDTTLQHLKIQLKFSLLSHSWILIYCSVSQHFSFHQPGDTTYSTSQTQLNSRTQLNPRPTFCVRLRSVLSPELTPSRLQTDPEQT